MASLTRSDWDTLVKRLKDNYRTKDFLDSKDAIDNWYLLLCNRSKEDVQDGVFFYIRNNKFVPTVNDIYLAIDEAKAERRQQLIDAGKEVPKPTIHSKWQLWGCFRMENGSWYMIEDVAVEHEDAERNAWEFFRGRGYDLSNVKIARTE